MSTWIPDTTREVLASLGAVSTGLGVLWGRKRGGPRRWIGTIRRLADREWYILKLEERIAELDQTVARERADKTTLVESHAILRDRINTFIEDTSAVLPPGSFDGLPPAPETMTQARERRPATSPLSQRTNLPRQRKP